MAERVPAGPLRTYLATPPPAPTTRLEDLPLLAVDLETTGLDPARDAILSIGAVPVDGLRIDLSGALRAVVRGTPVGHSAVVHGLTDDEVAQGLPLSQALDPLLTALTGRVLLAHHARVEQRFLQAAVRPVLGAALPLVVVDTLDLGHRLAGRGWGDETPEGSLRLQVLRARHGLPRYRSHEALTDALACAELYLAQVATLGADHQVTLGGLLRHRRV
ncbi:exonuclease domain-containing protein [Cellulomonas sp. APG4]|uniref:exonuclease domain-containing protein n=1 Tax=Cellulomonas sp. APG4 TaxID=1538656 RepID=UPI00192A3180|nr:exonuclease domain-containing protein [Cellulomonas sp. APG4]